MAQIPSCARVVCVCVSGVCVCVCVCVCVLKMVECVYVRDCTVNSVKSCVNVDADE